MIIPCHRGGHQCSWPACSLECDGRKPRTRPYAGKIDVGDLYTWEPDLPHALAEIVVVRIEERQGNEPIIWSRSHLRPMHLYFNRTCWNDESRFREAVIPSSFRYALAPLMEWETDNPHAKLEGPWPESMRTTKGAG